MTDISVVVVTHDIERRRLLRRTLQSLRGQTYDDYEVVLVADGGPEVESLARSLVESGERLVTAGRGMSLSAARNLGAEAATGDVYAFIDDDCEASAAWLETLASGYGSGADAVGGPAEPLFPDGRPWLLPERWDWLVGCGPYHGEARMVRNTYGCNISFRADVFDGLGGFDTGYGKDGGLAQGEETELCRRMRDEHGSGVLYLPGAPVRHKVQQEQLALDYLMRRAYHQGVSKAEIGVDDEESGFLADVVGDSVRQAPHKTLADVMYTEAVVAGYLRGRLDRSGTRFNLL